MTGELFLLFLNPSAHWTFFIHLFFYEMINQWSHSEKWCSEIQQLRGAGGQQWCLEHEGKRQLVSPFSTSSSVIYFRKSSFLFCRKIAKSHMSAVFFNYWCSTLIRFDLSGGYAGMNNHTWRIYSLYFNNSFVNFDPIFRNNKREELELQYFAHQMLISLFTSVEASCGSSTFVVVDLLSSVLVNITFIKHQNFYPWTLF